MVKSGREMRLHGAAILLAIGVLAACASFWVRAAAAAQKGAEAKASAFEVISIRPNASGSGDNSWQLVPDGLRITNLPLSALVYSAYDIVTDSQVRGLPSWVKSDRYDIETKVDADTAEAWKKLPVKEQSKQADPMIQSLLVDRCKLKVHRETGELPVYDLVIGKGGVKMKEAPTKEQGFYTWNSGSSGSTITVHATSIDSLTSDLAATVGRNIIDKTGLGDKKFDFELKWTTDSQRSADTVDAGPSIFTAFEEQLGLKLVPSKGPVEILVVDHMERPSSN